MSCQMSFQIPLLRELPVTVWTFKRLHPIVAERVSLQTIEREESLRALGAQVRTLARVRARVHDQVALAGETLPAVGAGVRQLARVRAVVQQQLPRRQKRFPARGAEVVLLPFVHLYVSCQARFAEVLSAYGAQVGGALVQLLVFLERVLTQESFVALAARENSSSLVEPLVLVKAGWAGESLLTQEAVVAETVELHVRLQLIGMFKNLVACHAFSLFLREDFVHCPCAQKPFVFPRPLIPSPSPLVLHVVFLQLSLLSLFNTVFLFIVRLLCVGLFSFLLCLCSGFSH